MAAFLARWLPYDKALHLLAGLVLFLACLWLGLGRDAGLAATLAAGALKEAYDAQHRDAHTVDGLDFLYTAAPGLAGWLLLPFRL